MRSEMVPRTGVRVGDRLVRHGNGRVISVRPHLVTYFETADDVGTVVQETEIRYVMEETEADPHFDEAKGIGVSCMYVDDRDGPLEVVRS